MAPAACGAKYNGGMNREAVSFQPSAVSQRWLEVANSSVVSCPLSVEKAPRCLLFALHLAAGVLLALLSSTALRSSRRREADCCGRSRDVWRAEHDSISRGRRSDGEHMGRPATFA